MAITGTFLANFSTFYDAAQQAVVKLRNIEDGASTVSTKLTTMSNSLTGVAIVQQATIAAEAVQRIGGVSALTEKELARVGATASEAAAKLVAMGQSVPPGIQAIADASHRAADAGNTLGQSWVARIAEGALLRDAVREVLKVMKEMAEFLPELAIKGSVVGDVEEGFQHLASSAGLVSNVLLGTLRAGTHGTIDDFALMQRANKDLAAGLNLTDQQFGLLAQGAFALAKVTGGSTADALDKMSDAMVKGQTRAVAMLTGKIDLEAAEEKYAASLGGVREQLDGEQKLEAARVAVLERVSTRLGALGEQHDSLKNKVEQDRASWANLEDDLGKTIARSPVIAAGFDGIKASLAAAFGTDQSHLIEAIAKQVDQMAIVAIDFVVAAAEGARVFNVAWNAIKTVVLGVEEAVLQSSAELSSGLAKVAQGFASLPGASQWMKDFAASSKLAAADAWTLAEGVRAETVEAALATTGHTAFDQTLDGLEGSLLNTRDAMLAASTATAEQTHASERAAVASTGLSTTLKATKEELKAQEKAAEENTILWNEWSANVVKASGTATDISMANLQRLSDDMTAKRILQGTADADYYALRASLDRQASDAILIDHARVAKGSIEALQQEAAKQQATLNDMLGGSLHYKREAIDAQIAIRDASIDALHYTAAEHKTMFEHMRDDVDRTSFEYRSWLANVATDAEKAALSLGKVTKETKDAAAAAKAAAEAAAARMAGASVDYGTVEGQAIAHDKHAATQQDYIARMGFEAGMQAWLDLQSAIQRGAKVLHDQHVPGFEGGGPTGGGGLSMLHPDEFVVPKGGALVLNSDRSRGVNITMNVSGLLVGNSPSGRAEFAQFVSDAIVPRLMPHMRFGS